MFSLIKIWSQFFKTLIVECRALIRCSPLSLKSNNFYRPFSAIKICSIFLLQLIACVSFVWVNAFCKKFKSICKSCLHFQFNLIFFLPLELRMDILKLLKVRSRCQRFFGPYLGLRLIQRCNIKFFILIFCLTLVLFMSVLGIYSLF